jgi:Ca-activated chloride channel homolog
VVVETDLMPRADAEAQYRTARQQGRRVALSARASTDVFTLRLTGLQPDQDVIVETTFLQVATPDGPGWELRLPLTIGPRYSRPDEAGTPGASGQPLGVWRDPGHRFDLDLVVRTDGIVASPSHSLEVRADLGGSQRILLRDGSVLSDRDLVLVWRSAQADDRPTFEVLVHEDLEEGTRYFLALVSPPATSEVVLDRETTLLVDRSGSMEGPKWAACRWAVRRFLAGLRPSDTFNLGLFASNCDWLAATPLAGTQANRERALGFLDAHAADGGTELGLALEQALRSPRSPGERARHVLLLTDAQVSDEGRLLQLAEAEALHPSGRRLSLICIDAAPRSAFVRDLADAGSGLAVFLSSNPHDLDPSRRTGCPTSGRNASDNSRNARRRQPHPQGNPLGRSAGRL